MSECCGKKDWAEPCDPCPDLTQIQPAADQAESGDLKKYIVTWTITLESDSADGAVESALDAMAEGNISPEVEEIEGANE